jgi:inosine/xanthosine triphosphatase
MLPLHVAVGSLRPPKLNAVRAAMDACLPLLAPGHYVQIAGIEAPSGVRATPISRIETMQGAKHRAEFLGQIAREQKQPWQFFVGLEGGVEVMNLCGRRRVFLESWVYVSDRSGEGHYGQSGAIPLPEDLVTRVVDEGIDLSQAVDAYAGAQGIRDNLGAWGVLTRGLITREEVFRIATINALSPFFK